MTHLQHGCENWWLAIGMIVMDGAICRFDAKFDGWKKHVHDFLSTTICISSSSCDIDSTLTNGLLMQFGTSNVAFVSKFHE